MTIATDIAALAPNSTTKAASRAASRNIESLIALAAEKNLELDGLLAEIAVTIDSGDTTTANAVTAIRDALA